MYTEKSYTICFDRIPDKNEIIARIRAYSGCHIEANINPPIPYITLYAFPIYFNRFTARYHYMRIGLYFADQRELKKSWFQKIQEAYPDDEQARQRKIAEFSGIFPDIYRYPKDTQEKEQPAQDWLSIDYDGSPHYLKEVAVAVLLDMGGCPETVDIPILPSSHLEWQGLQWWLKLTGTSLAGRIWQGMFVLMGELWMFLFRKKRRLSGSWYRYGNA